MRNRSAKGERQHRQRIDRLRRTSHGPERCQWPWGCVFAAVDAHESLPRSAGGDPADPDWLLCRDHHNAVTTPPPGMRSVYVAAGLIRPRAPMTNVSGTRTVPAVAKRAITIRVPEAADEWIAGVVRATSAPQSVALRAMLSVATQHRAEVVEKITQLQADA